MHFSSAQEEAIHNLSAIIFGNQYIFRPNRYDRERKEPADLVWIANRVAVLFYMTSGKGSFEAKRSHNYAQMHGFIRRWKGGVHLTGAIDGIDLDFSYDDVDYIVGISVVGGDDVGCTFDEVEIVRKENKLAICASITDSVFEKLAGRSVGMRDVIHFLMFLREGGVRVDEAAAIHYLDQQVRATVDSFRRDFSGAMAETSDLEDAWSQMRLVLVSLKSSPQVRTGAPILADLAIDDALWLSFAERSLSLLLARPGQIGPLAIPAARAGSRYRIVCLVAAQMKYVDASVMGQIDAFDMMFISAVNLGVEAPMRTIVLGERKSSETILHKMVGGMFLSARSHLTE